MDHVLTKMPTQKKHTIQSYSKVNRDNRTMYIYEVKYTDDFLATGLTNAEYGYTQENMTFYKKDNMIEMNVGNYMYHTDVKSISETTYEKESLIGSFSSLLILPQLERTCAEVLTLTSPKT